MLREFIPILDKFGDLQVPANLAVLIDHVCTFVERNQVTWNDVHDRPIKFDSVRAAECAADKITSMARGLAEGEALKPIFYLLSGTPAPALTILAPLLPPCPPDAPPLAPSPPGHSLCIVRRSRPRSPHGSLRPPHVRLRDG